MRAPVRGGASAWSDDSSLNSDKIMPVEFGLGSFKFGRWLVDDNTFAHRAGDTQQTVTVFHSDSDSYGPATVTYQWGSPVRGS